MKNIYESFLFQFLHSISLKAKSESVTEVLIHGILQICIFIVSILFVISFAFSLFFNQVDLLFSLMDSYYPYLIFLIICFIVISYFIVRSFLNENYEKIESVSFPNEDYKLKITKWSNYFDLLMVSIVVCIFILVLGFK